MPRSGSDLPVPTDDRVKLREVPEHAYVVHQFSGNMGKGDGHDAVAERERIAAVEGVASSDGGAFAEYVSADSKYLVARCVSSSPCSFLWVRYCVFWTLSCGDPSPCRYLYI